MKKAVPAPKATRRAVKAPRPKNPLVRSPAEAKRERARLRRGREQLEATPTVADNDIRSSLI